MDRCRILFPTLKALVRAVDRLRRTYPEDEIRVMSLGALESAVAEARRAALVGGGSCRDRKLRAAAALFYEIIMLHPLVDGNKRLAVTVMNAFLAKNGLPRVRGSYTVAIKVAEKKTDRRGVYLWLRARLGS